MENDRQEPGSRLRIAFWIVFLIVSLAYFDLVVWVEGATPASVVDQCVQCHKDLDGGFASPVKAMEGDIHYQKGLGCVGCHGGDATQEDPEAAMNPAKGFVARPAPSNIPAFCGKCHSNADFMKKYNPAQRVDQETEYWSSGHGKRLRQGNQKVATCVSCHGTHGIRPVNHPMSRVYPTNVAATCGGCHSDSGRMPPGFPTNQLSQYKSSVHARAMLERHDLSAPTCNDCHGNHGAAPPGVQSVANVCGTCHTRQAELFRASPHRQSFDDQGLAECVVCHENHNVQAPTDEMLGAGDQSKCVTCHGPEDPGLRSAVAMKNALAKLSGRLRQAEALVSRADRAGMEVSRAEFALTEAHDSLIGARVLIHSFKPDPVTVETQKGIATADKAYRMGEQALAELQFRRKGLAASLVIIAIAVMALYLKIQQIEHGRGQGKGGVAST